MHFLQCILLVIVTASIGWLVESCHSITGVPCVWSSVFSGVSRTISFSFLSVAPVSMLVCCIFCVITTCCCI
jgi:hypothetical protein